METVLPIIVIAGFQIDSGKLTLSYTVENKSDAVVYLVNRLTRYEDKKGWIPDAEVVYVFIEEGGRIELSKRVPPAPTDRLVTPRSYYVTPLAAGEKFEEELSLLLPVTEHRPYDGFLGELPEPRKIEAKVQFVLGVFPGHRLLNVEEVEVHGVAAHRLVRNPNPPPATSDPEAPPAEVLVRGSAWEADLDVIRLPKKKVR